MRSSYFRPARTEQLVAGSRLLLAGFSLLAIYLDPSEPSRFARTTYLLLSLYTIYSFAILVFVWRSGAFSFRWKAATHSFDLVMFSIIIFLTEGPGSPFMVYFVFALFCAALRFGRRGTLWTAAIALLTFIMMGIYSGGVASDPHFELNRFVIRCFYLMLIAVFLSYLSEHADRLQEERVILASSPPGAELDRESFIRALLAYAAHLSAARQAVLVWEEEQEPFVWIADWTESRFDLSRSEPDRVDPPVAEPLATSRFLCRHMGEKSLLLLADGERIVEREWSGSPLHPELQTILTDDEVLSVPVAGSRFSGRLFLAGIRKPNSDSLSLAKIVEQLICPRLDEHYMTARLRQTAALEERVRMARDLHDGILQALTGAGLELQTLRMKLQKEGAEGEYLAQLEQIQDVIASEQEELHALIQDLRPEGTAGAGVSWVERLSATAERVRRQWQITVELMVDPSARALPPEVGYQVFRVVSEALTNGARHARATGLQAAVRIEGPIVRLEIVDDGRGFPFRGRHSLGELMASKRGPVTLRERVYSLKGDMVIDSSSEGSRIEISIPLGNAESVA